MKRILILILLLLSVSILQAQQAPRPFIGTYTVSLTRPGNSTAYAAADVVNSATARASRFTGDWSKGAVSGATLVVDTLNATNGTFRLFLLKDTTGVNAITDNAAFSPTPAVLRNIVGVVDFTLVVTGTSSATGTYAVNRDFKAYFSGATGLYGILTASAAWVPDSAGVVTIGITVAPD